MVISLHFCMPYSVAKVSLQQTLECFAVAGVVLSHLMNGIMNSIQVSSLCALCQVEFALGCAVLCSDSQL